MAQRLDKLVASKVARANKGCKKDAVAASASASSSGSGGAVAAPCGAH